MEGVIEVYKVEFIKYLRTVKTLVELQILKQVFWHRQ